MPIVLVDDDDDDYFFIGRLLRQAGLENPCVRFSSGTAAIRFLRRKCSFGVVPRIVFLDVKMPGVGGFDVLAWIRSQPGLSETKVIVLSGSGLDADRRRAAELGADFYLVKFPPAAELQRLIADVMHCRAPATPAALA